VFAQLARDAQLLQSIVGKLDRVTALGPAGGDQLTSLAVTFAGQTDALIQWVLQPPHKSSFGKLTADVEQEKFSLEFRPDESRWQLQVESPTSPSTQQFESFALGHALLHRIDNVLAADPMSTASIERWKQACHAAELAEGAQQSLRRNRTIQLYYEEHSEEQTFKGVMAIGGCLVLLFVLAVLALSAVIDALDLPFRNSLWWRLWPLYVLAPAVLLLAAQSLWRVFATKPSSSRAAPTPPAAHD
jgi:hypothetical protein